MTTLQFHVDELRILISALQAQHRELCDLEQKAFPAGDVAEALFRAKMCRSELLMRLRDAAGVR